MVRPCVGGSLSSKEREVAVGEIDESVNGSRARSLKASRAQDLQNWGPKKGDVEVGRRHLGGQKLVTRRGVQDQVSWELCC